MEAIPPSILYDNELPQTDFGGCVQLMVFYNFIVSEG